MRGQPDHTPATRHRAFFARKAAVGVMLLLAGLNIAACDSTGPGTAAGPGQVPGGLLFSSDWSTGRGSSNEAVTDGGRWDWVSSDRGVLNKEVVSSSGLDFPTTNVFRVIATSEAQGWSQLRVTTLPVPGIDEKRFYRWYFRLTEPDNLQDQGTHPIESGGANNWAFEVYNTPFQGIPAGTYAVWFLAAGEADYNRMRWYLGSESAPIPLSKNRTYRFELQLHRNGANTFRMHVRIYDTADALLYDSDDFHNPSGMSLASEPTLALGNPASLATLHVGNNGIAGSAPFPFTYAYEGAVCVRADDWCGPYNGTF